MLKNIITFLLILVFTLPASAIDEVELVKEHSIQSAINNVGTRILNANKVPDRIIFTYDKTEKEQKLKLESTLTNRQVIVYGYNFKFIENSDELAAYISREVAIAARTFDGRWAGGLSTVQMKAAPKKYELVADKLAVDYMVNAGYNPIGLILFIHKSSPQKRFDRFSNRNLTSKRLAVIYEYIYKKYPSFLADNVYFETDTYQNFLITSMYNRRLLEDKIKRGTTEELKYE